MITLTNPLLVSSCFCLYRSQLWFVVVVVVVAVAVAVVVVADVVVDSTEVGNLRTACAKDLFLLLDPNLICLGVLVAAVTPELRYSFRAAADPELGTLTTNLDVVVVDVDVDDVDDVDEEDCCLRFCLSMLLRRTTRMASLPAWLSKEW